MDASNDLQLKEGDSLLENVNAEKEEIPVSL